MSNCQVCDHAKVTVIDAALANGRSLGLVAHQFRVKKMDVLQHLKHSPMQALREARDVKPLPVLEVVEDNDFNASHRKALRDVPMVTENPFSQFKQAWRLAKDDPALQAMMVYWLNEQLASDNMGL